MGCLREQLAKEAFEHWYPDEDKHSARTYIENYATSPKSDWLLSQR